MNIDILTLFPEMFAALDCSMIKRARDADIVTIKKVNIRDYTKDKHNRTDDYPFGGGAGMVLMPDPVFAALDYVNAANKKIIFMSPKGSILDQKKIEELSNLEDLVILCGHYEGIDQRILDHWPIEEISIGDYVLTGGEPAAAVLIDAVVRMLPGVLASEAAATDESIYSGLLEYPQYTQPREYRGLKVPEVLLSGNHKLIRLWQFEAAIALTKERRPDMFEKFCERADELDKEERALLAKYL